MSFNIFATGTYDFHYSSNNVIDQDTFNTMELMSAFQGARSGLDLVKTAEEQILPSGSVSAPKLIGSGAKIAAVHYIELNLMMLRTHQRNGQGTISVHTTQSSLLWTNVSRFARYNFFGNANPGLEFMRTIIPALETTDMNNWGVVIALCNAISLYTLNLTRSTPVMLQIRLSK